MGKNRPIVVATLGYIIGIIWGLYLKVNIVSFYALTSIFLVLHKYFKDIKNKKVKRKFKFISIRKIFRYIKLILDFKSLILIIIFSSISNFIVINLNSKYEKVYASLDSVNITCKIVDNGTNKEYKTTYKIKLEKLNGDNRYKGIYLYLDVASKLGLRLKYGDYINVLGSYKEPSKASNYRGFDYSKYLRTLKIYGTVEAEEIRIFKGNSNNVFFTITNNIFIKIKEIIQENLSEEKANLLLGILVGDKTEIPEEMQEDFKESNISHILAVSGLHVSYIILAATKALENLLGKRNSKVVTIFFIIGYMFITNFSPSVVRAGVMGIIAILGKLTYNKNDIWTSISISLLCILAYNPYLVKSAGVLLSYGGTVGIILFRKNVSSILSKIKEKSKIYKYEVSHIGIKLIDYVQDTISVSFSAQLAIAPIMAMMFNSLSLSFFVSNFFVSIIIGPIIILGFLFIISSLLFSTIIKITFLNMFFKNVIRFLLEKLLEILIFISKFGKLLPFNKVYIGTPEICQIVIYYVLIFILNIFLKISLKRKTSAFEKRIINWKNLIKHLIRKNYKRVTAIILFLAILIIILKIVPKDLKMYFIDVGQGDSTLIVTPHSKTILIDGGGSETYDVGKNTLIPYLLDRKITKIDYVIISHFDTDHVGGILAVLEELKVGKVIIGKQYENSENYEKFLTIIKDKNISVNQVNAGDKINIEKNVQIKVLFPNTKLISENSLNNNSLVLKLIYNEFSVLFTGDIEEIAEERLVQIYEKSNILKSTILKVAHHGSKSSSIQELLELVQPKIALIGVGTKNLYGHPNSDVLNRLNELRCKHL